MKISVIIPVYNNEKYLPKAIEGLMAQELDDIEFICMDDGSTDGAGGILDTAAQKDSRFHVVHNQNNGTGAELNQGLQIAAGKYVAFHDSDDFIEPDAYQRLYDEAEAHQADIVRCNYFLHEGRRDEPKSLFASAPLYGVSVSSKICPRMLQQETFYWAGIYSKSFLNEHCICFRESLPCGYEDISFVLHALSEAQRIVPIRDSLYHYRYDNPSSSIRKGGRSLMTIYREWQCFFKSVEDEDAIMSASAYPFFECCCLRNLYPEGNVMNQREAIERTIADLRVMDEHGWLKRELWPEDMWELVYRFLYDEQQKKWIDNLLKKNEISES